MRNLKRTGFITATLFLMFLTACGGGGSTPQPKPPDQSTDTNISVPDVRGRTQSAAQTEITNAGLTVGAVTREYSSTVAEGNVIRQAPAQFASVPRGTAVNLVISLGPEPIVIEYPGEDGDNYASGINGSGQVVGWFIGEDGKRQAFLKDGDEYIPIEPPGAVGDVYVFGINDSGNILLYNDNTYFLKDGDDYAPLEGHPDPSAYLTYYTALNDSGQFAGYYEESAGYAVGFIKDGDTFIPIEHEDAHAVCKSDWPCGTWVTGINYGGDATGVYIDEDGYYRGFVYAGGAFVNIDYPGSGGNGMNTYVSGINDIGQIAGYFWDDDGYARGFVYAGGSFIAEIEHGNAAADGEGTHVFGINNSGQVAGCYDDGEKLRGFVMDF